MARRALRHQGARYKRDPDRRAWNLDVSAEDLSDDVAFLREAIFEVR